MALTRRYLFHGHSAALGGRIVRIGEGKQAKLIKEGFIDLPASSLTVVGGRSEARLDGKQLSGPAAQVVRFGSARAFSEGVFDDLQGHYAVTLQERSADTLTTTTKVSAEVTELEVGLAGNPRMVIKRLRGGFASQSSTASGETPVQLDPETRFDGVTFIDREGKTYTLLVDVEPQVFRDHDTYSKLTSAASDTKFAKRFGHTLFLPAPTDTKLPTAPVLRRTDGGAVQGTIIKPLRWKNDNRYPGAEIDAETRHAVKIPELGTIYFGEISVARQSRRLTMMRATLGSPAGGDCAAVDVQDNGGWS